MTDDPIWVNPSDSQAARTDELLEQLRSQYKAVFLGSELGRKVLADILALCNFGVFLRSDEPEEVGKYNVGLAILNRCGMDVDRVTKTMLGIA